MTLVRDCGPEWPELARKLGVGGVSDTNEQDPVQSVKGPADAYGADVCTRGHRQAIMNGLGLILELGVFGACGSPTTADGSVDEASSTRTPE